ncbi:potassium channel family protein [Geodermatophilus sp. SYSU D00684]
MGGPASTDRPPGATAGPAELPHGLPGRGPLLRGVARTLLTTAGLLVVYALLPLDRAFTAGTVLALGAGVLAVGVLVVVQVRAILRSRHPGLQAVEGIALSLPLFLLLFATVFVQLSGTDPRAFSEPLDRVDGVYFVVTVFTTVGFGDITAVSTVARVLTTLLMVGDLVLIGLVLKLFLGAVDRRRAAQTGAAAPGGDG